MTDRRQFLAFGGSVLAARAFAGLRVFDLGIPNEQVLKIERLEINLGLGKAFKAFHISDTHLNFFDAVDASTATAKGKRNLQERWVRFPQALSSFYASLDYARENNLPLLHTGDLVDFVTAGNERFLAHNVKGLDWHFALGNHEYQFGAPGQYEKDPATGYQRLRPYFKDDLAVSARVIGGANFVAFDNACGNVPAETVARVKAEFEKPMPVVLLCHIPPVYTEKFLDNAVISRQTIARGMGASEEDLAKMTKRPKNVWETYDPPIRDFYTWLQAQPRLKAILCGHTHIAETDRFSDTAQMYVAGGNYEGRAYEIVFK